jgi:Ca2+-binding RTX toxin-like protein
MFRNAARHLAFESLETRQLLAADVSLKGGVLTINGTAHSNTIDVERVAAGPDAGKIQVTMNGKQKLFDYLYDGTGTGSISSVVVHGRSGSDHITIADDLPFSAVVTGGRGNDTIQSGAGDDIIRGGRGNDTILTGAGDDLVDAGRGDDHIEAGEGTDTCSGGRGNDTLSGGDGKDTLNGDAGNDEIEGDKGHDAIFGGAGNDKIFGGSQDDLLDGGAGNDELHGESGQDVVFGQLGDDVLDGGDNNDYLDGGAGNDNVLGGAGDDELKGGLGSNMLDGQEGHNLLDNDGIEADTMLNGIVADLDREFLLNFATGGPNSFAKFDLQNINDQVVEKLTVQAHGLLGQTDFDLLVDGHTGVTVPIDSSGDASIVYSSDPTGSELPFPLGFPPVGSSSTISGSSGLAGTVVQRYVI